MNIQSIACPYCGGEFVPGRKVRSPQHHRRFFAMMRAIYDAWPETHTEQPKNPTELRKWLTAKAGYVDRVVVEAPPGLVSEDPRVRRQAEVWMARTIASFRRTYELSWVRHVDDQIVVFLPRSISYATMTQTEFSDLNDRVRNVVWQETGLDVDELLEGAKKCRTV